MLWLFNSDVSTDRSTVVKMYRECEIDIIIIIIIQPNWELSPIKPAYKIHKSKINYNQDLLNCMSYEVYIINIATQHVVKKLLRQANCMKMF